MSTCSTGCKVCYRVISFTLEQLETDESASFRWKNQVCEDHERDERRRIEDRWRGIEDEWRYSQEYEHPLKEWAQTGE